MTSANVLSLKRAIFVLSLVTTGLGCWSHFDNTWTKSICFQSYYETVCVKPYEICDLPGAEKCPKIEMERFFVAIVIICCICSFLGFFLTGSQKATSNKTIDAGYHVVAAVLLIGAAAVYFVSMEQITNLFGVNKAEGINFRRPEKLAAAVLTVVQGVLCGFVAQFIVSDS